MLYKEKLPEKLKKKGKSDFYNGTYTAVIRKEEL